MVSLIELFPTVLEAAGATVPERRFAESSMSLEDRRFHDRVYAEMGRKSSRPVQRMYPSFVDSPYIGPRQAVGDDQNKLTRGPRSDVRLCDWRTEPDELDDLADGLPEVQSQLEADLDEALAPLRDEVLEEDIDDERPGRHLKTSGTYDCKVQNDYEFLIIPREKGDSV